MVLPRDLGKYGRSHPRGQRSRRAVFRYGVEQIGGVGHVFAAYVGC
jgi:hypothetical protein